MTTLTTSLFASTVFLSLALGGMSSLVLAIFADVGVTVLVVLNGLQLYGYRGQ